MKGILLAGGSGSRLFPTTKAISKQLLPIYNKPLVFYPLTTLMSAGIRNILVISTPQDTPRIQNLLGSGEDWGINLTYAIQAAPNGIAEAFVIGADFIDGEGCALALGDNLHYGPNLSQKLRAAASHESGATLFAAKVLNPEDYGVIKLSMEGLPLHIIEKPSVPDSDLAVTGLYFYDTKIVHIASNILPSKRGELEITDVNNAYLRMGALAIEVLNEGDRWVDAGTCDSMLEASIFVREQEKSQKIRIGCPFSLAWQNGWIGAEDLTRAAEVYGSSPYASYLNNLALSCLSNH